MKIAFADLVGTHLLTGRAEYVLPKDPNGWADSDAAATAFKLDGVWYQFAEDENDGYRSGMRDIEIVKDLPSGASVEFEPVTVTIHDRTSRTWKAPDGYEEGVELLVFVNEATGLAIAEVGTRNTEDYYPYFVHRWTPEGFVADVLQGVEE